MKYSILVLRHHILPITNLQKSLCQLDLLINIKNILIIIIQLNVADFSEHFKIV